MVGSIYQESAASWKSRTQEAAAYFVISLYL